MDSLYKPLTFVPHDERSLEAGDGHYLQGAFERAFNVGPLNLSHVGDTELIVLPSSTVTPDVVVRFMRSKGYIQKQ